MFLDEVWLLEVHKKKIKERENVFLNPVNRKGPQGKSKVFTHAAIPEK